MRIRNGSIAAWMVFAGLAAWGQQGQVTGPVTGYVFDSSARLVRPVLGIPGASVLGTPVTFSYSLAAATISPRGDTAVAVGPDGSAHLVTLAAGAATEIAFNGLFTHPDRVIYSPSGSAVALIGGGRAQVVTGMGTSPTLAGMVELSTVASGGNLETADVRRVVSGAGSLALSDDGNFVLESSGTSIQLTGVKGGRNTLLSASRGSQVAFAPSSHDAAVMDPGGASLVLIHDAAGAAGRQTLAQTPTISQTAGVAFSADGKSLFLAAPSGITVVDAASGNRSSIMCDCDSTGIYRMGNVYRLNDLTAAPLWLLDTTASPLRIVFVPALVD